MTALVTQTFIPGPRLIDGSDLNTLVSQINSGFTLEGGSPVITALTTVGAGTITAAGIVGGITARGGAQSATAFSDTTDTAAAIIAAAGSTLPVGSSWIWTYENTTDGNATLLAGSSVTLAGNIVIPKLTSADYLVKITSATAVSITFFRAGQTVPLPYAKYSVDTAQSTTITVTGITGAQLCYLSMTGTTPGALKLPTAADIIAATPNGATGLNWTLSIGNPAATSLTLTGLTGTVISGTAQIGNATARQYNVAILSPGSVTLTGLTSTTL